MAESKPSKQDESRAWEWLFRIVQLLLVPLLIYVVNRLDTLAEEIMVNREKIIQIEASRFTASDGLKMQREVARLWTELATFPKEIPPQWFVQRVDKIEDSIDKLSAEVRSFHNGR